MAEVILTVTCNPAIDVTYTLGTLVPGEVHRVHRVERRPGGKGVNVSSVLHQLGQPTLATGFADAGFDTRVRAMGVDARFIDAVPCVRQTLVVHGQDEVTSLWEPGERVAPHAVERLLETVADLLPGSTAIVVSGSLPPGAEPSLPATLAAMAHDVGVPAILDLDGEALALAARGTSAVLTPNREELGRLLAVDGTLDVVPAVEHLSRQTESPVIVTLGAAGLVGTTGRESWHVRPLKSLKGNATGAGDAAVAAVALGISGHRSWPELLVEAVAMSAAAVVAPVAGEIDIPTYQLWRRQLGAERVVTLLSER